MAAGSRPTDYRAGMEATTGLLAFEAAFLLIKVWAVVNCLRRPGWAFERADTSKALWIGLLAVSFVLPCLGVLIALWYLFSTDRRVVAQMRMGPGIGFPGGGAPIG
jgi:hypothetical protein